MTIAAEDRLLLATAHTSLSPANVEDIVAIASRPLDWGYFVEVSIRHAVSPLVHAALDEAIAADPKVEQYIPLDTREELRRLYDGSARRNRRLFRVLGDIVRACHDVGAQALGLKDVQLAVDVYPERALRPMGDVDVLIHHDDYELVAKAMAGLGFSPHPRPQARFVLEYGSGQQFRRTSDETWVDMQWDVAEREWDPDAHRPFGARAAHMWERSVPLRIDDYTMLAPCPEDMLLHLCLHLEGHEYCELVLFSDIAEFLRHYRDTLDWHKFNAVTRDARAEACAHHVLQLTARLFGLTLPSGTLDALAHKYFAAQLYAPIFGNLTSMHQTLDDLDAPMHPPADVMADFERVARRQTAQASALHLAVDGLAQSFVDGGGSSLTFLGTPSRRVFPDASVPPFETIHAFILAHELPLFRVALEQSAYVVDPSGTIAVKDEDGAHLRIEIELSTDVEHAMVNTASVAPHANRAAALQSLRAMRHRSDLAFETDVARVVVHAVPPDIIVTKLAAELGRRSPDASSLFHAFACIDLPERVTGALDASAISRIAARAGVGGELRTGLAILETLLGDEAWATRILRDLPGPLPPDPRVLEWARYGPEALSRTPELRPAFLWLLAFTAVPSARRKARYFAGSLTSRNGEGSSLPRIAANVLRGFVAPTAPKSTRDLCYWVESAP
jgi:hypothetical protein